MTTPSPSPPFIDDESALLIIDWSWWLNKAFRIGGLDGMVSLVVGWLTRDTLSYYPAHVVLALDSPGPTFRHRMRHPFDEAWRYKADREIKPTDFYTVAQQCTEIAEMHAIPALWADGYEADDVIATATRKARAAGYRVWICSSDKDLEGLVDESDTYGILTGLWDNSERTIKGPIDVETARKVTPAQIADFLAITGDSGDNVPGVPELGPTKAAAVLQAYGNLESALSAQPLSGDVLTREIDAAQKAIRKAPAAEKAKLTAQRERMKKARSLARDLHVLLAHAEVARFSRQLTGLDFDAPVDVPWNEIPLGGLDADALRARYKALGFENKFSQVTTFRKRAPWAIGYNG